jgi:hypothetical protein
MVVVPRDLGVSPLIIPAVVALAIAMRALEWVSFPIPQVRRQTNGRWAKVFPWPMAAAVWGFDVGLGLSTWMVFGGLWVVVCLAILLQSVVLGVLLFTFFWLGRALPVWIGPFLVSSSSATIEALALIRSERRTLQVIHAAALVYGTCVLSLILTM